MATNQRTIPFKDGMALGLGVNDLTGDVGAVTSVNFENVEAALGDQGMEGTYDTRLVNTAEQMYSSLGISVEAEGRYGLFQAEGKFGFAQESRFNTQSTFLVARTHLTNAFQRVVNPAPTEDAAGLVKNGKTDTFRERYGDLFISGIRSGGEYIAVISITSESSSDQRRLAIALKASYDSIAAGGSVSASLDQETQTIKERSEVRVSTYQRGGAGEQISYTATIDQVSARLSEFPTTVQAAPKAIWVLGTPYSALVFPEEPSWFDLQRQRDVLEDSLRKRLQLSTLRNDLDLLLLHPEYFEDPPTRDVVSQWDVEVTQLANELDDHVAAVVDNLDDAEFFALTLPTGLVLPPRIVHSGEAGVVEAAIHADFADEWEGIPGGSQKFPPGMYDDAKGQLGVVGNDAISAFKVPEGLTVRCYEHAWFQGRTIDFTEDVRAVPMEWNDKISSLAVFRSDEAPPVIDYAVALDFLWSRPLFLKPGRYEDLGQTLLGPGALSAILIPRGVVVRLFDQPGCQGERLELFADALDLTGVGWDNRAASLEVFLEAPSPVG